LSRQGVRRAAISHGVEGRRRAHGLALCLVAVLLISPDALILRTVRADTSTTLFWRGVFTTAGIVLVHSLLRRRAPAGGGRAGGSRQILAGVLYAGATLSFVAAVRRTDVANVFVIVATGPLIAAALGRAALGELVPARTWVTSVLVLVGLAWTFGGSLRRGDLDGDLLALAGSVCFAGFLTVARRARPADLSPAIGLGGAATALVALVTDADVGLRALDLGLLALLGLAILPTSLSLQTRATGVLQAPEVSLVMRLESLLAPLWVWLAYDELPSRDVVLGGSLILIAVAAHSALSLARDHGPEALGD
jgi:drug/metabolite transporter (DMT)-like permease